jgi:hypothetical protein
MVTEKPAANVAGDNVDKDAGDEGHQNGHQVIERLKAW